MKNRSSNTPLLEDHFLECGCVCATIFSNEKSFLEHTPTQEKLFFRFEIPCFGMAGLCLAGRGLAEFRWLALGGGLAKLIGLRALGIAGLVGWGWACLVG